MRTSTTFSIGRFMVWAVLLTTVSTTQTSDAPETFLPVVGSWIIGEPSASIPRGRLPPQARRHVACHRADPPAQSHAGRRARRLVTLARRYDPVSFWQTTP
jgi:hypothetical protein